MTLAVTINLFVSVAALGFGAWFVLAGAVALTMDEFEPMRVKLGHPLFIRVAVAAIIVGLVFYIAGVAAALRVLL